MSPKDTARFNAKRRQQYAEKNKKIHIPRTPEKYADFVQNLVEGCTPRKKQKLRERGIAVHDTSSILVNNIL